MKKFVFANQKGGVGKTTLALNFAWYASKKGKTLFIDLDPQSTATWFMFGDPMKFDHTSGQIYKGYPIRNLIQKTRYNDFFMIPTNVDQETTMNTKNIPLLKAGLNEISNEYDIVVIDTRPSIDSVLLSALSCADFVIIPMRPEQFVLYDFKALSNLIAEIKQKNYSIKSVSLVINNLKKRTKAHSILLRNIEKNLGNLIIKPYIKDSTYITEATMYNQMIEEFNPSSLEARDIRLLCNNILKIGGSSNGN